MNIQINKEGPEYSLLNYGDVVRSLDNEELTELFFSLFHNNYPSLTIESFRGLFNSHLNLPPNLKY